MKQFVQLRANGYIDVTGGEANPRPELVFVVGESYYALKKDNTIRQKTKLKAYRFSVTEKGLREIRDQVDHLLKAIEKQEKDECSTP